MEKKIAAELLKIEKQEQVTILYAVESGSRAWGFPSQDSDYDVRFIYVRPTEAYLSIEPPRDVLEYPISELLDVSGWDLVKTLQLFRKCNPSLLEWLQSPIVYRKDPSFHEAMMAMSQEYFSSKTLMYHYLHMAHGNFRGYLQGEHVKIKKYFYVLRPIFACEWLKAYHTVPPILFDDLLECSFVPKEIQQIVIDLLEKKKRVQELDLEPRIDLLNQYIDTKLTEFDAYVKEVADGPQVPVAPLNQFFRDTLARTPIN